MLLVDIEHRSFEASLARAADLGGADLIFTSPPYHDARTVSAYGAPPWTVDDDARLGDAVFAALRPGGHCLLVVDAPVRSWRQGHATERGLHPWRLLLDWADRVGFTVRDRLAYGRGGSRGAYVGRFRNDWEPMFWFQRPGVAGYFDKGALDAPSKHPQRWRRGKPTGVRRSDGTFYKRGASGRAVNDGIMRRGTLWDYGAVGRGCSGDQDLEATEHPARFPARLADDVVRCFSPHGGLVCDPFIGSGTTAVSAARYGRGFVGGDIGARERDGRRWADIARDCVMEIVDPAQQSLFVTMR